MRYIKTACHATPAGKLILGSIDGQLCLCEWADNKRMESRYAILAKFFSAEYVDSTSEVIVGTISQLNEYFNGIRKVFTIPVIFAGTPFQNAVWKELLKIPYGDHISYKQLAERINKPNAVRAVAMANSMNLISILIPCHRVVGSNGKLTGYAGGLQAKQFLLDLEAENNRDNHSVLF